MNKGRSKWVVFLAAAAILTLILPACAGVRRTEPPTPVPEQMAKKPPIPQALGSPTGQEPRLKVYIKEEGRVQEMPFEEYVAGVVGGEIKNDWPMEAIKAQAIIARTFVLKFIKDKGHSKYGNAHISTDIEEAQAWNMEAVNERIKKAVAETRGQVIVYNGDYVNAWFHSNAGGKTATAVEGLAYKEGNPPYIQVVSSPDDSSVIPPDEKSWSAEFSKQEVIKAVKQMGKQIDDFSSIKIGRRGPSGRAIEIVLDSTPVSAPDLRIALGSTRMKSTLLDEVRLNGDQVIFKGRGYGHGVGMSQWGAYSMAKRGKKAEDIIKHYFKGVQIVKLWP
ncbi:stage II sporulation protein D [Caldicoprobacter guelmensis]|uniref:SpoIID/LytB domain-containing protein n=1 Tax=Caldicoprobacter guelmensis TaxID=1170224 RepID=UPI001956D96A|nr:SpoIID/LytB domain-containing protein [Caldicoprobacter guelmensis]MBM7582463.1 stage II sporulation protein D [Caldicoprobacter guelmensis]